MEVEFLNQFVVLVVVGICLCVGYVIKTSFHFIPNNYIPLIMLILGTLINCAINYNKITAEVILAGMVSGLSSTGLYEAFRNLLHPEK